MTERTDGSRLTSPRRRVGPEAGFSPVIAPMRPTDRRIWQAPGQFAPPLRSSFILHDYYYDYYMSLCARHLCTGAERSFITARPGSKARENREPQRDIGARARDRKTRFSAAWMA